MLRQFTNKNGQNTAEYALLIALVIAGVIAMQQYAQRSLQARMRDAGTYLTEQTAKQGLVSGGFNNPGAGDKAKAAYQYEPYYQQSNFAVTRSQQENKRLGEGLAAAEAQTNRTRTGEERTTYTAPAGAPASTNMPGGL